MMKERKESIEENNVATEKNEKKKKIIRKPIIVFLVIVIIIGIYYICSPATLKMLREPSEWSNEQYEAVSFGKLGGFKFTTADDLEPIEATIPTNIYIYLGSKHIITIGKFGIKRLVVDDIEKGFLTITYDGKQYNLTAPIDDDTVGDIGVDEIGCYTCNECHTLMYEPRTKYYVSNSINEKYIGALKTEDKIPSAQKVNDSKRKKIALAKNVKYYKLDMHTKYTSMNYVGHKCSYKELSYDEVSKMYDGSPKYAYIWLNSKRKAEIILYVDLEVEEVADEEVTDEEVRKYIEIDDKKDATDYKNIHEIAGIDK